MFSPYTGELVPLSDELGPLRGIPYIVPAWVLSWSLCLAACPVLMLVSCPVLMLVSCPVPDACVLSCSWCLCFVLSCCLSCSWSLCLVLSSYFAPDSCPDACDILFFLARRVFSLMLVPCPLPRVLSSCLGLDLCLAAGVLTCLPA